MRGEPLSRRMMFCDAAMEVLTYSVNVEVSISAGIHQGLIQEAAAVDPNPTVSRSSGSARSSTFPWHGPVGSYREAWCSFALFFQLSNMLMLMLFYRRIHYGRI